MTGFKKEKVSNKKQNMPKSSINHKQVTTQ